MKDGGPSPTRSHSAQRACDVRHCLSRSSRSGDTRSFGTAATCGLSTANEQYTMSDGASLFLTVAVMADRTKFAYGGPIAPDEEITDPKELERRGVAWLLADGG